MTTAIHDLCYVPAASNVARDPGIVRPHSQTEPLGGISNVGTIRATIPKVANVRCHEVCRGWAMSAVCNLSYLSMEAGSRDVLGSACSSTGGNSLVDIRHSTDIDC